MNSEVKTKDIVLCGIEFQVKGTDGDFYDWGTNAQNEYNWLKKEDGSRLDYMRALKRSGVTGKRFWNKKTAQGALYQLQSELLPIWLQI